MSLESKKLALFIREHSIRMVFNAQASHIGSALSIADLLAVLYANVLNFDASNPSSPNRDRFILSKGHATVALYAALAGAGIVPEEDLVSYGVNESKYMNHASHQVRGVEISTGSLGHGLPIAVGKALYSKARGLNWRTFVIVSDGELDEGSNWEGLLFATHHQLSNLFIIVDYNNLQSLGTVSDTLKLEPLLDKFLAFGCHVEIVDGHDHDAVTSALVSQNRTQPTVLIANTIKGKGIPFMENSVEWHYRSPNLEEFEESLRLLFNGK
jgi:transketolase